MSQKTQKTQKRFFWLKLHHDFFNRDEIRIIESQPNGKDYVIFYLKLMLKSINDNGKLLFKDTIPYTPEMLASITQTSIDTVRVAIDAFVKLGLITLLDDGALFMQEVQKLVGSETVDAERMRIKRAAEKEQAKLPLKNKVRTGGEHCSKNVTLENKSIEIKSKDKTPYSPPIEKPVTEKSDWGIGSFCSQKGFQFSEQEITAITQWFTYKSQKYGKSILAIEVEQTLVELAKHKTNGYDIAGLINRSIANGYTGIMSPTKEFLLAGKTKSQTRYQVSDYITPKNSAQKNQLHSYLCSCYLRKVNPKTGAELSLEEKKLIAAHYKTSKYSSPHIGWEEYIYQNEVLSGICLLDQPLALAN